MTTEINCDNFWFIATIVTRMVTRITLIARLKHRDHKHTAAFSRIVWFRNENTSFQDLTMTEAFYNVPQRELSCKV